MADEPKSLSAEDLSASIPAAPTLGAPLPDGAKTESQLVQEELERLLQNCTPEDQKMYEKRFQIIQELLATEWGYVNDLKTLVATFLAPVRKSIEESDQLIPPDEINNIFSNVEAILGFNEKLYIALRKSLGRGELAGASRVGTVFYRLADFLKMYTIYCQNHKNAVDSVIRCAKKHREFGQFLEKQSALPEVNGLFLKDYLIKPVQRLCKYPLLFQEILRNTPKTHPDYPEIEATIDKVKHVADSINKSTALQENFNKMLEVSDRLTGFEIMSSDRWYVKEQTLTGYSSNDKEQELKERHVFLFNDLILFTKLNKKKYQFKEVLRFYNSTVQDQPDNAKKKNYFEVTGLDQDNSQAVFTIACASLKEKTGWLQTVTSTINTWNEKFKGQPQELPKLSLGETPPGSKRSSKNQIDLVREGESSPHHSPSRGHSRQGSNGSTGEKKGRRSQTLEDMAESSEHEEEKKKEKTEDKRSKLKRSASSSKMTRKSSISSTKKEALAASSKLTPSSSGPTLATAKEETELSSSPNSSLELRASSMDKTKMTEVLNQAKDKKDKEDKPEKDDEVSQLKSKIKKLQQEIRAERRQKNDLKQKYDTLVETFTSIESTLTRIKDFMPPTFAAPPMPPMPETEEKKETPAIEVNKENSVVPAEEKKETPAIEINNANEDAGQPIDSPSGSGSSQTE